MEKQKIREPRQQRSIEKKQKIAEAGLELICQKGYYHTNTAEIAKLAGVSTGIVYSYFRDKKDILLAALQLYSDQITSPMFETLKEIKTIENLPELLSRIIDSFADSHRETKSAHEELGGLAHTDPDVYALFLDAENKITAQLTDIITSLSLVSTNIQEKVHMSYHLVEDYCHEITFHKHDYLNAQALKQELIRTLLFLLSDHPTAPLLR
ncbi:TetR/AcrR family transcriptional regulator [Diplocloster modestus]|uniref:TetR/AcrR family transcriptional regulator n=1 Tax=Diplocloster modestus TaxID=2850322 RepID=A0ABS6KC76_9FIRM|nr:TetR/AcrR family transcriptional regulator [Diplocloster modestus]MBU9728096.1 TetR/AcrR family transcriptional regulator [Diplocloster modestus]